MRRLSRKEFITAGGLVVVTAAVGPALSVLAGEERATQAPSKAPRPVRLGMVVDPAKCAQDPSCEDCIVACHKTHNVPAFPDKKDEVKWLWKGSYEEAFHEHEEEWVSGGVKHMPMMLLCNHCDNPPCTRVCPTQATWKRADGVVMIDPHRCIGCRFCAAACPYGSRSFIFRDPKPYIAEINPEFPVFNKGVVVKCNFCEERLAKGKLPACVEACKQKALVFGDLEDPTSEAHKLLASKNTNRRKLHLGTRPQVYYITG
ncbi:MAG: sulfate reduction electron transfer complex DsrMKJOP subunit DsrO [Chloroflexota bacterium]